jgi:hypothetical protein
LGTNGPEYSEATRNGVAMFILGSALGGIVGMFFGTTYQSARKDELIAGKELNTAPRV